MEETGKALKIWTWVFMVLSLVVFYLVSVQSSVAININNIMKKRRQIITNRNYCNRCYNYYDNL